MRTTAMISALLLSCSLAACVSDDGVDQGPEDDPLSDGKDDSYYSPTDHGTIPFNEAQLATITDARRYHRWSFELTGDADLVLDTRIGTAFGPQLDTVLYLYEDGVAGYLEKNDDAGPGWKYSEIRRRLGPGTYHVIVKGKYATARGPISIAAGCDGRGCFGEDWLQALKDQYDASGTDDLTDISFSRLPTAVKAAVRDFEAEFDDEQYADFFSWDAGDAGTAYLAEVYDEATLGVQIYDRAGTVMATGYATESSALEWSDDGEGAADGHARRRHVHGGAGGRRVAGRERGAERGAWRRGHHRQPAHDHPRRPDLGEPGGGGRDLRDRRRDDGAPAHARRRVLASR
jgi:hypothetical protein